MLLSAFTDQAGVAAGDPLGYIPPGPPWPKNRPFGHRLTQTISQAPFRQFHSFFHAGNVPASLRPGHHLPRLAFKGGLYLAVAALILSFSINPFIHPPTLMWIKGQL